MVAPFIFVRNFCAVICPLWPICWRFQINSPSVPFSSPLCRLLARRVYRMFLNDNALYRFTFAVHIYGSDALTPQTIKRVRGITPICVTCATPLPPTPPHRAATKPVVKIRDKVGLNPLLVVLSWTLYCALFYTFIIHSQPVQTLFYPGSTSTWICPAKLSWSD